MLKTTHKRSIVQNASIRKERQNKTAWRLTESSPITKTNNSQKWVYTMNFQMLSNWIRLEFLTFKNTRLRNAQATIRPQLYNIPTVSVAYLFWYSSCILTLEKRIITRTNINSKSFVCQSNAAYRTTYWTTGLRIRSGMVLREWLGTGSNWIYILQQFTPRQKFQASLPVRSSSLALCLTVNLQYPIDVAACSSHLVLNKVRQKQKAFSWLFTLSHHTA